MRRPQLRSHAERTRSAPPSMIPSSLYPCVARHLFVGRKESQAPPPHAFFRAPKRRPIPDTKHAAHRECRVRNCAGTTTRQSETLRTITLPGTPRRRRWEHLFPFASRPPFARAAWSPSLQFTHRTTTLLTRRWDAGGVPEGRIRRNHSPGQRPALVSTTLNRRDADGRYCP